MTKSQKNEKKLFYPLFGALVALLILAGSITLLLLHGWLTRYEAAQPTAVRSKIMESIFLAKDWQKAASEASLSFSPFETGEDYAAYMDAHYGDAVITSIETSAGLSGGKQYIVKADAEEIARFTLKTGEGEDAEWQLSDLRLSFAAAKSVTVRVKKETTVSLNGITVDPDRYTTRLLTAGTGEEMIELTVDGLLNEPTVTLQKSGTPAEAVRLGDGLYAENGIGNYTVCAARMEFHVGNEQPKSEMIPVENGGITLPIPEAPAGKHFAGWAEQTTENGKITATVRFKPVGKGRILLPVGYELLSMRLHAIFENGQSTAVDTVCVSVCTTVGHTVWLDGKQIGEDAVVMNADTEAEEYLPEGVHGLRLYEVRLTYPEGEGNIAVKDENGKEVALSFDPENNLYTEQLPVPEIDAARREAVINAVQVYARYMINAATATELKAAFDSDSAIYRDIRNSDNWMQNYTGYRFTEPTVGEYYDYGNGIFSAQVTLTLRVTRKNGSEKEYPITNSLLLKKTSDGAYKVFEMTNQSLQTLRKQVRLDFYREDTLLESRFVDAASKTLTLPAFTPTEGKTLRGWALRETDDSGNTLYTLLFTPDQNGIAYPSGALSPLELYAVEN